MHSITPSPFNMATTVLTFTIFMSLSLMVTSHTSSVTSRDAQNQRFPNLRNAQRTAATLSKVNSFCADKGSVPDGDITWNPVQITNNLALNSLCQNTYGTFPNPCNCSQFVMCTYGIVELWECASKDTSYLPFNSQCTYTVNTECPNWPSVWNNEAAGDITCARFGQRQWDPPVSLPLDASINCGEYYANCYKFEQYEVKQCEDGKRYSKAYFGCIDEELCEEADKAFGLWKF